MPPLPVTLLTGFLGAGKSTLLGRVLAEPHHERIGVVVNELGPAGIDVPGAGWAAVRELTQGCVCCVQNPDLVAALEELAARGDLDRVVLETTGLADPLPLTWTLARPEVAAIARLDAVVTVVDAANHAATQVEEWRAQVGCADLIVMSKLDLVDAAGRAAALAAVRRWNAKARVVEGLDGVPLGLVVDVEPGARETRAVARHSEFGAQSFCGPHVYRLEALEDLLEELPEVVFRAKGIVRLDDGTWVSFHVVGDRLDLAPDAPPPPHGESRVVLFGRDLRREELEGLLARCRR